MNVSNKQQVDSSKVMIQLKDVNKWYGQFHVLKDINLTVTQGERIVLCGPSGSGKSTTIRCINRLEEHQKGQIIVDGTELTNDLKQIETIRSEVGMVFQHFNLFPHKTVLQNVTEGPIVVCNRPKREAEEVAMDLLAQVGLAEKHAAYPNHLSGGQKQRVAIARALAMQPEVLLLDEVTSALDPELVGEVLAVIRKLAEEGMTMAIVTHEMAFAADVASRVLFLDQGVIAETGSAEEVILNPQNPRLQGFVARFKG